MRFLLAVILAATLDAATIDTVRRGFENPPDDARIMMRWWWYGAGVTKPELEKEMRMMRAGGIGGFEVQPVYPLAPDQPDFKNLPYLSDGYLDALRFTAAKARELGLRMDVTLGSGWPFGGPHTLVTEAAGRLRVEKTAPKRGEHSVPLPDVVGGEKLLAVFLESGGAYNRATLPAKGRLAIPNGETAVFFISSRTGQQVKRAAVGAEGYVLDHYDRSAIEHHLATVGDRLMSALRQNPPYAVFSDSLEVFASDWTGDLLEQFQKRRGYDLTPYLPALIADIGPKTADVRHDWGKTLTELCEERYLIPIRDWARKNGTRFRSQTYGVPPVVLSSNALVDLPEGEQPYWRKFTATRWASSASHLYSKPVTSSETWTWLHSPVFRATPLDMKAEADLHFLQGVNQLIGHGWPYSPDIAGEPGWRFYAAAVFNHHNPWWVVMPDVAKYLQRVSYLLRQGSPANDVAVYLPVADAYSQFTAGKDSVDRSMDELLGAELIPQILDAGYNFDFIDDAAIAKLGLTHKMLVLPKRHRVPPETERRIAEYKAKGGIVVDMGAGEKLRGQLSPDFLSKVPAVGFIHRHLDNADVYFVANTGNQPVHTDVAVRSTATNAEWWDASTGRSEPAKWNNGVLNLALAPYESRVLVLSAAPAAAATELRETSRAEIRSPWKVTIGSEQVTMNQLRSWHIDEATRYYSGTAVYQTTVDIPAGTVILHFGEGTPAEPSRGMGYRALFESPLREAAVVEVNGKRAGSVWKPPYELDITPFVRPGSNELRITVGNLAVNQLAGQKLPDYRLLNLRYTERFTAQDMGSIEALPSGLVGPVTIVVKERRAASR